MVGGLKQVGLLGGTFDPPHKGHLALARAARASLPLAEIWLIPAGQPVHKDYPITPARHRLAMARLLAEDDPTFQVDTTDLERAPPHYTATLIPILQARHPQTLFWLIIGGDSLRDLASWHRPDLILRQLKLAVLPRPGVHLDWLALCRRFPTLPARMRWLNGDLHKAASREIRAGGADQANEALPPAIATYIASHGLYARTP